MKSSDALLYIDELSGAYNRRYLRKLKDDTVTDLILGKIPFTVAVTDIDHFKDINDLYGHITGDKAIKYYADFLKKSLRREDIIVRYGGDEFVIVQKGLTKDDAFLIWQRIIRKLRSSEFERGIRLSISVGVARGAVKKSVSCGLIIVESLLKNSIEEMFNFGQWRYCFTPSTSV